jgi:hypothetical protein
MTDYEDYDDYVWKREKIDMKPIEKKWNLFEGQKKGF